MVVVDGQGIPLGGAITWASAAEVRLAEETLACGPGLATLLRSLLKKPDDEKHQHPAADGQTEASHVEAVNVTPTQLNADKTAHYGPDNAKEDGPN
jgi:hypothetical protein